jgi:methylated-DNA-protein-cysteine methyltransferase-like protein
MIDANFVYDIVSKIPQGKVMTYKQIAKKAGLKNPRNVGYVLKKNEDPQNIPCHRVIKSDGKLASGYAFGGRSKQKEKLELEGIVFFYDKIDLEKFLFN